MKSGFEIRPMTDDDIKLLNVLNMTGIDTGQTSGGNRYIGWGETSRYGFAPMGIVDISETPYVIEPHIIWLPWVTVREKYNAFKWFLEQSKKVVFLIVLKQYTDFYEQMTKRGILRKVGVLNVPVDAWGEIHMYQKVEDINV